MRNGSILRTRGRTARWLAAGAVLLFAGVAWSPPAAALSIDPFSAAQGPNEDPPGVNPSSSTQVDGSILGLERDLRIRRDNGGGTLSAAIVGGSLTFQAAAATAGQAVLAWDGQDADAAVLDTAAGLGGVDLTQSATQGSLKLTVASADAGVQIICEIHSGPTAASRAVKALPQVLAATDFFLDFHQFVQAPGAAAPADLASVRALVLRILGSGVSAEISHLETVPPQLAATKVDAPQAGTPAHVGDTIKYTITIDSSGGQATAVDLEDLLDANLTLVEGTIKTTPVAIDDQYTTVGGTQLAEAAPGALGNDFDADDQIPTPGPSSLTVSASDPTSAEGGTVNVSADGSFTYDPPAGFRGVDSFAYTAIDDEGLSASATVWVGVENQCPTAVADAVATDEDTASPGSVLAANPTTPDSDPEGDPLTVVLVNGAAYTPGTPFALPSGTLLTMNADGTFTYDPNGQFEALGVGQSTSDDFTYAIDDSSGTCAESATVTVTIHGVNDAPVVVPSPAEDFDTISNTTLEVAAAQSVHPSVFVAGNLLANFTDVDGPPPLSASLNSATPGAVVTVNPDGTFVYTPPPGLVGSDTFDYDVADGAAGTVTRTVTIHFFERVWYVKNDAAPGGLGRSTDPFDTLVEAETASAAGDHLFIYEGDGTTAGHDAGIALKANQKFHGEAVGLSVPVGLNGNPAPTDLVPAGSHPRIDHASGGHGIAVTDPIGIEIRGLDVGGDDNAIRVVATDGNDHSVTISDSIISAAVNQGIRIVHGGTGTVTAVVNDVALTSSGNAFDARTTAAGGLVLDFNNNTGITSTSGLGVYLDGSGGGPLTVRSFTGNTVSGATAGTGINANTVTFDADLGTAGLQTVNAGTTAIGASGDGVGGSGLVLANVTGDLSFADLDVVNDGGTGVGVTGTGTFTGAGGFRITIPAGSTVAAAGGPAVDIDPATVQASFDSLTSTSSPGTGVTLTDITGSFTAGGSISGAAGTAFHVLRGTATVTYSGTINNTTARSVVVDALASGGSANFTGTITDSGTGIAVNSNAGAVSFADVNLSGSAAVAIAGNAATVTFSDLDLNQTAGAAHAFDVNAGAANVNVTVNANGIRNTTASRLVNITGRSGGTVAFGGAGALTASVNSTGINISGAAAANSVTLSNSGGVDLGTGTGSRIPGGLSMTGNAAGTSVTFSNLDVFANNATGILASGGGTLNVATGRVDTTGGVGIDVNGPALIATFTDVDVNHGSGGGVLIQNSSGAKAFQAVNVTNTGGTGLLAANAGSLEITGSANTLNTTTGTALSISGTAIAAGDVTFRSIAATGGTNAIVLNNTGSTGGLKVTGNGGTCGPPGGATTCSGGTIDGFAQAVLLTNTANTSLRYMRIRNTAQDAIVGVGITDGSGGAEESFEAVHCEFFDIGSAAATDEVFDFATNKTAGTTNITGTLVVDNCLFDEDLPGANNSFEGNAVLVENHAGTLVISVTNSAFHNTPATADKAINIIATGTNTTAVHVTDGLANEVRGEHLFVLAEDSTASADVNYLRNEVRGNNTGGNNIGAGVAVAVNKGARASFDILDNCPTGQPGCSSGCATCGFYSNFQDPIEISLNDDNTNPGGSLEGRIHRNRIEDSLDRAIALVMDGDSVTTAGQEFTARIEVINNYILRTGLPSASGALSGINAQIRDSNSGAAPAERTVDLTFRNNEFGTVGHEFDADYGMYLNFFNTDAIVNLLLDNTDVRLATVGASLLREGVHLRVRDNATVNATVINGDHVAPGDDEIRIRTEQAGSTACLDIRSNTLHGGVGSIQLQETAGTMNVVQISSANLASVNGIPAGNVDVAGTSPNFGAVASCPQPAAPTHP